MKLNKVLMSAAAALLLTGCYDTKMEWVSSDSSVSLADLPLELAEQIANYDYIKNYAEQYTPQMSIGLGLGADLYASNDAYKQVCDDNFQIYTCGNAMKQQSVVGNSGARTWTTIDAFLEALPSDIDVYGHNFIWHTQQNQTYLKSLIAPTMVVVTDSDSGIANVMTNGDFETGDLTGWSYWSNIATAEVITDDPYEGEYCAHFEMNTSTSSNWDCQLFWELGDYLVEGETYAYSYWAKSDCNLAVQFIGQNASWSGIYKDTYNVGSDWTFCSGEFEYDGSVENIQRVGLQFGGTPSSNLWLDDFQFGLKVEDSDPMANVIPDDDVTFDGESCSWGSWGSQKSEGGIAEGEGVDGSNCYYVVNSTDGSAWNVQVAYTFSEYLDMETTYTFQAQVRSSSAAGQVQFQYQNSSTYGSQGGYTTFDVGTDWITIEKEFNPAYEDVDRIILNCGTVGATYYIDNVKFGPTINPSTEAAKRKGSSISYVLKTDEEKREALLTEMEAWIQDISEHVQGVIGADRLVAWDVINEPIMDSIGFRGIDGFGGTDDDGVADSAPTEDTESGLSLNWANGTGNGHFYWGYYLGLEYATKAFEYARKYNPNAVLFVNEYNLETSPSKLAKLIEFVNYIDANGSVPVDGIGTQMHVAYDIDTELIRDMFTTLAATGKQIRVTELDVSIGTASPSSDQLATQADTYQAIVDLYKEIIPESQQHGITIWTLSDSADEHEYWLPDCSPNLFDSSYERKHAYKGFCDGIAGYDISTDFDGTDWAAAY